jgi:hypothetical protein
VNLGTGRDVAQRQGVPDANRRFRPSHHGVTNTNAHRSQHVALLAVYIVQEGDARRAVWIVFNGRNLGRHADLVALEVDDPVEALVAATPGAAS